jgi:16S rRNA pseudouridine516 synthase
MNKLPLDRILQSQGFGTRKWCRELIEDGEVSIAGETATDSRANIETENLEFTVYGETHRYREHLYIALNKPADYECSRKPSHHPGVLSLLPEQFTRRDVQPVGRLDQRGPQQLVGGPDQAGIRLLLAAAGIAGRKPAEA